MPDDIDAYVDSLPPETVRELAKLNVKMSRHKDTRRAHLKNVKAVAPDWQPPADIQMQDFREEETERRANEEIERRKNEANAKLAAQKNGLLEGTLLNGRKFTPEQVKEIEEQVMPKYGIGDYEAAAKIYLGDMKPEQKRSAPSSGANWTFPESPGLFEDPAKWARDQAFAAIDEIRGRA